MSYFPLFLDVKGVNFLVVGSGKIALAKVETILEFGGEVVVLGGKEESLSELAEGSSERELLQKLPVKFIKDSYDKKYLNEADVVISATNNKELNQRIASDAKAQKKLANIVDDGPSSNFIFGSYFKQGNVTISTSTSGSSPVLARILKEKIATILPRNLELLGDFAEKNRELVKEKLSDLQARRLFWRDVIDGVIGNEIAEGNIEKAQELLEEKLQSTANEKVGAVYFIGAGPGDPELLTFKAVKLLNKADIVLHDRLVTKEVLSYARKDAVKINVGKTRNFHPIPQEKINGMIREYALQGNIVVRLKGGDPSIFAHLSEEIEAISDLKIPYQVVPGITAASAVSAFLGTPLTSRTSGKAVRFLTIYKENLDNGKNLVDDFYWKDLAATSDTLVFYMSSHNLGMITERLIKFGRDPKTPLAVVEQASTQSQKKYLTTIGDFEKNLGDKNFISPSLAIIGEVLFSRRD